MTDSVEIYVKAGNGGPGCRSFKGRRFTRSRRRDGGNGGDGADVILKADKSVRTLGCFRFRQHFRAENGRPGLANKKKGANGRSCIIKVPAGTIVRDIKMDLVLEDLNFPGQQLRVARGGAGGKGNAGRESAAPGTLGEERRLLLELKLVTDIGIIGYPNCGKSTLLSRISSARPKVAGYPFTTTSPVLGVVQFSDFAEPNTLTIAELPGLVKDAGKGRGLGAHFLRHAERAKLLLILIDMLALERKDPVSDYQDLSRELKYYNPRLLEKEQILVANKLDSSKAWRNLRDFSARVKRRVFPISALEARGIDELLKNLRSHFS